MLFYKISYCQDAFISQTYLSGQYYNPAFTGACGSASISTSTRMEFIGMHDLYQTSLITGDYYIKTIKSGVGMYYLYDKNMDGKLKTNGAYLSYAFHYEFGDDFSLQPGVQVGYLQKKLHSYQPAKNDIVPLYGSQNPYGMIRSPLNTTISHLDVAFGALLYDKSFFSGLAFHHLNIPKEKYIGNEKHRLPLRIVYHIGYNIQTGKLSLFTPSIVFIMHDRFMSLHLSGAFNYNGIIMSLGWYKNFYVNGFALQTKFGARYENLIIGYSFEMYISDYEKKLLTIHELAVQLILWYNQPKEINTLYIAAY
ncbi:MAG: PorP/SprF family type IX secretion system membrane protein [Bacteroidia bacterium]|nr:PorP/SprF family type IX secretion system membrane protein [Bacteroidia bacterium]